MFQSATLKLTLSYAGIIIAISLLFSVVIYSIASSEVGSRIGFLQKNSHFSLINQSRFNDIRDVQIHEAEASLVASLIITNLVIWLAGGIGSYYLAKHTLRPIQEAHEAQSRFTSDASHELKTPLASMKIELEVALRDANLTKEEMHELLQSNLEEVNKLTALSKTLLQLSTLDHSHILRERVSLQTITKSVVKRFNKVDQRVEITPKTEHFYIRANKSSVEELLTILIDNALKYSPQDSKINVTFVTQKNMSGFEVKNKGDGIPADVLPYIFDRFYQVDPSRTGGKKKGFGLGLSLAKKLVQLHDGELTVSSAPKQETTFRVLLPNFNQSQSKKE